MNNKKSILFGVLVLILTIGLNVRHVMNDYGVKGNKLHMEVLAQTDTTNGDSSNIKKVNSLIISTSTVTVRFPDDKLYKCKQTKYDCFGKGETDCPEEQVKYTECTLVPQSE